MKNLASATKIVLIWVMLVLGIVTLLYAFRGGFNADAVLDIFKSVIIFITGYYFSKYETQQDKLKELDK